MGKFSLEQTPEDALQKAKNLLKFMVSMGASESVIQEKMSQFSSKVQDDAIADLKAEGKIKDKA